MRPEDALTKIRSSVHSPGPIRVLGPLSNSKWVIFLAKQDLFKTDFNTNWQECCPFPFVLTVGQSQMAELVEWVLHYYADNPR